MAAVARLTGQVKAGGNFIDTANIYQNEESEVWIGEWMAERGCRDRMAIATKFSSDYRQHAAGRKGDSANHGGNHRRSLAVSVRDSLRKLQTDFIDVLYVHWWDYTTSLEELMDSLDALVRQGKVLYLGASDTPAWVVAAANAHARARGLAPFSVYSGRWNLLARDFERDILPMARHFGMALCPWGVLGSGKFHTHAAADARAAAGDPVRTFGGPRTDAHAAVAEALEKVAGELGGGLPTTAVALAYVMRKGADCGVPNVFPVVGGRRPEQLHQNIRSLTVRLTDAQMDFLESVQPFDVGFPTNFIGPDPNVTGYSTMLGQFSYVSFPNATGKRPSRGETD